MKMHFNSKFMLRRITACFLIALSLSTLALNVFFATDFGGGQSDVFASVAQFSDITGATPDMSRYLSDDAKSHPFLKKDDKIEVIIETSDEALIDTYLRNPSAYGSLRDYSRTSAGRVRQQSLFAGQQSLMGTISAAVNIEFKYRYDALLSGFSADIKYGDIAKIRAIPGVKNVIISESYAVPMAIQHVENPVNADPLTGIYDSSDVGFDGTGTIVGILDTGLDYLHPAFQNQPDPHTVAKSFQDIADVASSLAAAEATFELRASDLYISHKIPFAYDYADWDPDVFPTSSHGTHVAGIVAGTDDVISGVAPNAQLAIFKVFADNSGSAPSGTIFAALNDAALLGLDVINMSLGTTAGFATEVDNEAVDNIYDKLRNAGINLMVSAGNESNSAKGGTYGDTNLASNPDAGTLGSPASYSAAMSVASINGLKSPYLETEDGIPIYLSESTNDLGEENNFLDDMERLYGEFPQSYEYVVVPGVGRLSSYSSIDVTGKIALVKRGDITFEEKAQNAADRGAKACIIFNHISGTIAPFIKSFNQIPVAAMTMDNAALLKQQGRLTVTKGALGGPFISEFSSWGVLPNLELKPEIAAHGGNITSAVIGGGHDSMSGTSMSSPNMAGAITLIRQYIKEKFPDMSAYDVCTFANQLIMSTATVARNEEGNPYSPRKQGAGLADIYNAVRTDAFLYVEGTDKTKVTIGDDPDKTGVYTFSFNLKNISSTPKTYTFDANIFTETLSSDLKTVAQKAYMFNDAVAEYTVDNGHLMPGNTVVVQGFGDAQITVTISLTETNKKYLDKTFVNGMYVEGFIRLTPALGEKQIKLAIPYLAFYGDWTQAPMLDPSAYEVGESLRDPQVLDKDKLKAAMYSSKPVGTFWGEYGMYIGQYVFKLPNGESSTEVQSYEDRAALSLVPDSLSTFEGVYAGLLRAAKRVDLQIKESLTGKMVYTDSLSNIRKSYGGGSGSMPVMPGLVHFGFNPAEYGLIDNSKYTFSMQTHLDWEGEQNNLSNSFEFSFYMDSQKPLLEKVEYRTERQSNKDRHYLDIYVYDNHYVQAMSLSTFNRNEGGSLVGETGLTSGLVPVDGIRNSINKVTIDVTENWDLISRNDEQVSVEFFDYAMNYSQFAIQLKRVDIDDMWFSKNQAQVDINGTVDLKELVMATPSGVMTSGTNLRNLKWEIIGGTSVDGISSNAIAKVYDGQITGISSGTAAVKVTSFDGKASATINVTVSETVRPSIKLTGFYPFDCEVTAYRGVTDSETGEGVVYEYQMPIAPVKTNPNSNEAGMYRLKQNDRGTFSVRALPWNVTEEYLSRVTWRSTNSNVVSIKTDPNDPLKVSFHVLAGTAGNISAIASVGFIEYEFKIAIETIFEMEDSMLTRYTGGGSNGVIIIPEDLNITAIGEQAFIGTYENNFLQEVTEIYIPEGVTEIRAAAFAQMLGLKRVHLPKSLKRLGAGAFAYSESLEEVNLTYIEHIEYYAFFNTALTNMHSYENLKTIGDAAFAGDSMGARITSIDLRGVVYVGKNAFRNCIWLSEILFPENIVIGDYAFGNTAVKSVVIPFDRVAYGLFARSQKLETVTFLNNVYIDSYAFYESTRLREINFAANCSYIGVAAFYSTALTEVRLPDGLRTLEQLAFGNCWYLNKVVIGVGANFTINAAERYNADTVEGGGISVFAGSNNITEFVVEEGNASFSTYDGMLFDKMRTTLILCPPAKVLGNYSFAAVGTLRAIGSYAFAQNQSLTSITDITGVESIGGYAFFGCSNLTTINFSTATSLTYIGESAFEECRKLAAFKAASDSNLLSSATKLEYIGDYAFCYVLGGSRSVSINLGNRTQLRYIGMGAFLGSNISAISLPTSLTRIEPMTFYLCQSLTTVNFPTSLVYIGELAFYSSGLTEVNLSPTKVHTIADAAFNFNLSLGRVRLPTTLRTIGIEVFGECDNLTEVVFEGASTSNGLTYVGQGMFQYCGKLTSVTLAPSIVSLYDNAFYDCGSLTDISFANITHFGASSLAGVKITEFNAPSALYFGSDLFFDGYYADSTLVKVNAPKVLTLDQNAFRYCLALLEVSIPKAVYIGRGAFYATPLNIIDMSSVEFIGAEAFMFTEVSNIVIPKSLKRIEDTAFSRIFYLKKFTVEAGSEYFFADKQGVLYSYLPAGGYQLEVCPQDAVFRTANGETVYIYEILDGTVRIAQGAFFGNHSLLEVVLPRTLKAVGPTAFYNTSIIIYHFRSHFAPIIETIYTTGFFDYYNFTDALLNYPVLAMTYPSNGKGYDDVVINSYFIIKTQGTVTLEDATVNAISAIDLIPATITLNDRAVVEAARLAYAGVVREQVQFVVNYDKLQSAEAKLVSLQQVENLIAAINALPETVTESDRAMLEGLLETYNSFTNDQKSQVTNISAVQDALNSLQEEPLGVWLRVFVILFGLALLAGCGVYIYFFTVKKSKGGLN